MARGKHLWALLLLGSAAIGLAAGLGLWWELGRARSLIRQSLERRSGWRVTVGEIHLGWPPGRIVVRDLRATASDGQPLLEIPRLVLTASPLSVVQRSLRVTRMLAEEPELVLALDRLPDLALQLERGGPMERDASRTRARLSPAVILPSQVSVAGGRLILRNGAGQRTLAGLSGSAQLRGNGIRLALGRPEGGRLTADLSPSETGGGETRIEAEGENLAALTRGLIPVRGPLGMAGTFRPAPSAILGVTGEARLTVERLRLPKWPELSRASARLRLTPTFVEVDEFHALSGERSRVGGHARLRVKPPLRLTFGVSAPEWDFTPWLPAGELAASRPERSSRSMLGSAQAAGVPATPVPLGQWVLGLRVDGRLAVARGRIGSARFENGSAHVLASDGEWIVQAVRLPLDGGVTRGYLKLSLRDETGMLFLAGERVPLGALYAVVSAGPVPVSGRATYSAELRWRGLGSEEIRRSLRGTGFLRIEEGALPSTVRAEGAVRPLRFRELTAPFTVARGRVVTEDLSIRGEPWMLRGSGEVGLGGKILIRLVSPPDRAPALQAALTGDLANPRLSILRREGP